VVAAEGHRSEAEAEAVIRQAEAEVETRRSEADERLRDPAVSTPRRRRGYRAHGPNLPMFAAKLSGNCNHHVLGSLSSGEWTGSTFVPSTPNPLQEV